MSSPAAGGSAPGAGAPPGPDWEELLEAACRGEGLAAAYQPIVDTARCTVVGYDSLARFPGFAEKNPQVWFSAARAHGRSAELESAALRTALAARSTLPPNSFLTLNVSPDLLALRPSLIKIDRELIQDVDRDEAKRALIEMLGTFAGRVDAWILSEGVERVEELDALVSLGVPLVQGYYLARPAPSWAGIDLDLAHLDTPLSEALARSMTRATSSRFEPLLVTDNAGRYAGVARMERMITALATPGG